MRVLLDALAEAVVAVVEAGEAAPRTTELLRVLLTLMPRWRFVRLVFCAMTILV